MIFRKVGINFRDSEDIKSLLRPIPGLIEKKLKKKVLGRTNGLLCFH
jgi:hypothetical protein